MAIVEADSVLFFLSLTISEKQREKLFTTIVAERPEEQLV